MTYWIEAMRPTTTLIGFHRDRWKIEDVLVDFPENVVLTGLFIRVQCSGTI